MSLVQCFTIPCEEGSASLSYVFHVAVRAGRLIDSAFVKFSRRSDGLVFSVVG